MIKRETYFNELQNWKNQNIIKVITGIRRCGNNVKLRIM